ncbi:MAG: zinc ribbon domain-containing protein [Acidobacteria bacterium]|nr:zinc ribbon domain-containing protein [Acidobacteriota bacterium]
MPIYEYRCNVCGNFEQIQKMSDDPLSVCPGCGGRVERLLSAPAFQFKGSGWYITDYARKNSPSPSPAPSENKDSNLPTKSDPPKNTTA